GRPIWRRSTICDETLRLPRSMRLNENQGADLESSGVGGNLMARKGHPIFASLYDRMTRMQEQQYFGPIRRKLLHGVKGKVLDVGAGTGANLPYFSPDCSVTALEPDRYMRRRGVQKAS